MAAAGSSSARLRDPEEIALAAGESWPRLLLPDRGAVFADRALRLRQVAAGHPMREYLLLLASVCDVQHESLQQYPKVTLADEVAIDAAASSGRAVYDVTRWRREPCWRNEWRKLMSALTGRLAPDSPARAAIGVAASMDDEALDRLADRMLSGVMLGVDAAHAPLIAAGLQVYWTHLLIETGAAEQRLVQAAAFVDDATRCPICASPPVVSLTRIGGESEGYRYLCCSLCSAQWHMVRVKCAHCLGTQGIHFEALQPQEVDAGGKPGTSMRGPGRTRRAAIQAECCDRCGHYLKILHMGEELQIEPFADDLASLPLDLLVGEAGFARHGSNPLLVMGEGEADGEGPSGRGGVESTADAPLDRPPPRAPS